MIFHSFQYILHLSCKYDHFWKKVEKHFSYLAKKKKLVVGFTSQTTGSAPLDPACFWIESPTSLVSIWTRLAVHQFPAGYKIDHKSKKKNWKVDFSLVSAHCASFMKIGPFLREREGGGNLHILTWNRAVLSLIKK